MSSELDSPLSPSVRAELGELVERHTDIAMRRILRDVGIYLETDEDRRESRKDFDHLRKWRGAYDALVRKVGSLVVLAVVTGIIGLVAIGAKVHFK